AHCVCEPPALAGAVDLRLRSCERRRSLWSEKTTVCRIFSCQRIAEAGSLAAAGGPPSPLRGYGATASLQTRGLASLTTGPRLTAGPAPRPPTCVFFLHRHA